MSGCGVGVRAQDTLPRRTYLEGEEEREPAEHLWADDVLSVRMDREANVAVQVGFEVAAVNQGIKSGQGRAERG